MNILFREAVPTANIIAIPCITSNKQVHILADIFSVVEKEKIAQQLSQMNFHGEKAQTVLFPHNDATYLFLGFGDTETLIFKDFANLGATIYKVLSGTKAQEVAVLLNERTLSEGFTQHVIAAEMGFGAVSRSYRFDEYRTKLKEQDQPTLQKMTFVLPAAKEAAAAFVRGHSIAKGMFLARDLMCSPPNDLYPASMADKLKGLEKLGVEVEILTVKEMEKHGMDAILAVGKGSSKPPRMVIMKWMGGSKKEDPIAFVGKGVTFDTGGISLKPGSKMDEMKMDMGGAAIVSGLMKTLASRKAKVNAIGVVGLAENMPDGNAYRPGDIVKTMSGQTIEVLNTDAEGRVVLSDALWYTQATFKPKFIIDLATLTGAMIVSLGNEFAGIFTNKDHLADELRQAGEKVGERVWRLPLDPNYNKMIDSDIADMKNISGGGGAGSITAAEFLQRFVNNTPWVHIDIAGVTWLDKEHPLSGKYPSGYGIRLLDDLVHTHYEEK